MYRIFVYTNQRRPGLHLWRVGTSVKLYLHPVSLVNGWAEFECRLNEAISQPIRFMLFSFDDNGDPIDFEDNAFQRELPRLASGAYPEAVWCVAGAARVVTRDPRRTELTTVRVHLISQSRYRPSEMFLWDAVRGVSRRVSQTGLDALGPFFDLHLEDQERSFFSFKFVGQDAGEFRRFEPDTANRWWVADDGAEVWTHSGMSALATTQHITRQLTLHYRQSFDSPALLHLWAENGDYVTDVAGVAGGDNWTTFTTQVYTHLPYACMFHNPSWPVPWEHEEAKRTGIVVHDDTQWWTLEGDHWLFESPPTPHVPLKLTVANSALSSMSGALFAHVWVNRARAPLATNVPVNAHGDVMLQVYPHVATSIKFHDTDGGWEQFRHVIRLQPNDAPAHRYVVLERPPLLAKRPPDDLIADPPFIIRRPGAYIDGEHLRFAVHTPHASDVQWIGDWTDWSERPIQMRCTRDGTYWWGTVPIADVVAALPVAVTDYHGMKYQLILNQIDRLQDPAANWVESSQTHACSRLVNHQRFDWGQQEWQRPSPEYYVIYQLHPSRFTNRFPEERPLRRLAREISEQSGYFRELGITAIQLLPVNEVGSQNSWGYDPAYFYAIENDYCGVDGPDDLKHLVRTCHEHGLAVILDVVFNHAGGDNILWEVARDSFFDGDTQWGALVNFDHPQCLHFFAQNLVYLANEFRIDAFRLDHTATIVHSAAWDPWSGSVRQLGSGGGWEFLHGIRHAVRSQVGENCLLMAEHLPNEWGLTNYGGPMDAQWGDDFHDRLIEACGRQFGMTRLAEAMRLTHTACDRWYKVVNYPESHDEVGNVPDRVANVAGFRQGWRMSKVAAATTLLARGIPLYFMGAESGEHRQFRLGVSDTLDIDEYLENADRCRIRAWWRELGRFHRDPCIQGPSPLEVCYAKEQILAFARGQHGDVFVVLNFGGWSGFKSLAELQLPWGDYRELWNSTWPAFAIQAEHEDEHTNGGRDAHLHRHNSLHIPDYGVVVLQRW